MKRSDLVLAQKAYAARQVKVESKVSKQILKVAKADKLNRASRNKLNNSGLSLNSSMDSSFCSIDSAESSSILPAIRSPVNQTNKSKMRVHDEDTLHESDDEFSVIDMIALQNSATGTELVNELSYRSSTAKTSFRKMQAKVQKEIAMNGRSALGKTFPMNGNGNSDKRVQSSRLEHRVSSRRDSRVNSRTGSRAQSARSELRFDDMFANQSNDTSSNQGSSNFVNRNPNDENYFMPKVRKLRPDGASLLDIYNSKREDTWGKIIRAQLRDEEIEKSKKKQEREKYEEEFGALVKKQIEDNKNRNDVDAEINEKLAKLSYETSKKYEDLQKKRNEDARTRHKEFIANALEDIETKRVQKEKDLIEEITSATIMVNKAKAAIVQEAKAKESSKIYHKNYQDAVYQDNIARLARKEKEKLDDWADTKRIIQQKEAMDDKELRRRKEENASRLNKSVEGPAHKIVDAINKRKKINQDKFYQDLINKGDTLNLTLLKSEDEAQRRGREIGKGLESANLEVIKSKQIRAKQDEEHSKRILATMAEMIKDQEQQVLEEKEAKRQNGLQYQRDLDTQLSYIRQKSMDSLTKTMTDEEMRMNAALIRKTGVSSIPQ